MTRCAILGLGSIGHRLARRVAMAGFDLSVWNRTPAAADEFRDRHVRVCDTAAEACRAADVVLLVLTDATASRQVLSEDPLALADMSPGGVVVDLSTIHPDDARGIGALVRDAGAEYVDAPFTGGSEGADAGSLTLFCGGSEGAIEAARPVLGTFATTIAHLGPVGAGQVTKSVNQVILASHFMAAAEAVAMSEAAGLDARKVLGLLGGGAAASWVIDHRGDRMVDRDFPPAGKVSLHLKDLGIALSIAGAHGQVLPAATLVAGIEQALVSGGHGDEDVSCIIRYLRPGP